MKIDLHIHTNKSDGANSFDEVINEVLSLGIDSIAITDHDVVNDITESKGVRIITGIELSTIHNNGLFHVLGYHCDHNNENFNSIVRENLMAESDHSKYKDDTFISEFAKKFDFDYKDYEEYPIIAKPVPGQQFISKAHHYLIEKNYCKDRGDFFRRILPEVFPQGVKWGYPKFVTLEVAIKAIQNAGGYAILAHPFSRRQKLNLLDSLELVTELGIDGFECFHPDADQDIIKTCINWCKSNNKYITGGSDYHGGRMNRKLGLSEEEEVSFINLPIFPNE